MKRKPSTLLCHDINDSSLYHGAVVPPIFQNSLFTFNDWDAIDNAFNNREHNFIYSRGRNPTVQLVEEKLAQLACGERAQLFPSGMAAITAACLHFLKPTAHIIAIKNMYGPANNLLVNYLSKKMQIETTFVSGCDIHDFEEAIQSNTALIYLESPSSAIFSLQDIKAVTCLAKEHGIKTIIDNTWATPLYQKPLSLGVDLEVHSCSKYLGGHSDIVGGVIIGKDSDISSIFHNEYELLGAKTAPMEAWLLLRSLRTLTLRLQKHQKSGLQIAQFLESHNNVVKVNYPGLSTFDQHELAKRQMFGFSGLMSFKLNTDDINTVKHFVNQLKIFKIGVSWGGHESLIYVPAISYLKEMTDSQFKNMGISLGDIRISVGLEDPEDLIVDLKEALDCVSK